MNKHPYTYTILRYVHDTSTGEFVNVGVVLVSQEANFAEAILKQAYRRLSKMFPGFDGDHFRSVIRHLQVRLDEIAAQVADEMELGQKPSNALEMAHSVIAPDDSSFQWSPMGSGLSADLRETLESIYQKMVEQYDEPHRSSSRNDDQIWRTFKREFQTRKVLSRLSEKVIGVKDDEVTFSHAWMNNQWHCLEPLSFDLMQAPSIREKAHAWLGRMTSLKDAQEPFRVYYLVGEPQLEGSKKAFDQALAILDKTPVSHEIIRESEATSFAERMAKDIAEHDREVASGS